MPQSLSKVYVHIIFSTKHRQNLIDDDIEGRLYEYVGGICKNMESNPVQVGGYKNHIHILCTLSRKVSQMRLIQEIKQVPFYWQDGYGIFSVSIRSVEKVSEYILNQKNHHQDISFEEEYLRLLKKYRVEYDTRYLWD